MQTFYPFDSDVNKIKTQDFICILNKSRSYFYCNTKVRNYSYSAKNRTKKQRPTASSMPRGILFDVQHSVFSWVSLGAIFCTPAVLCSYISNGSSLHEEKRNLTENIALYTF